MSKDLTEKKRRRRTCADQMRRDLARRRERRSDPAGKVLLQLLALLSALLALAPPVPEMISPCGPRRSPWQPPAGYPNGRMAWARERGLEPEPDETPATPTPHHRPRPQSRPMPNCSWSRLVKDLNRRPTRERARVLIEQRVPEAAHGWLRETIAAGDWHTLRTLGRDADAATIRKRALLAARISSVPELEMDVEFDADVAPVPGRK